MWIEIYDKKNEVKELINSTNVTSVRRDEDCSEVGFYFKS